MSIPKNNITLNFVQDPLAEIFNGNYFLQSEYIPANLDGGSCSHFMKKDDNIHK